MHSTYRQSPMIGHRTEEFAVTTTRLLSTWMVAHSSFSSDIPSSGRAVSSARAWCRLSGPVPGVSVPPDRAYLLSPCLRPDDRSLVPDVRPRCCDRCQLHLPYVPGKAVSIIGRLTGCGVSPQPVSNVAVYMRTTRIPAIPYPLLKLLLMNLSGMLFLPFVSPTGSAM